MTVSIAGKAPWLTDPKVQHLLAVLAAEGEEARVAGGAVRNTLLGAPVTDVDIATTNLPEETIRRAEAAGLRAIPTGIEHGTVTIVADGQGFEVTTLRYDIETDGRHARVAFGSDWRRDAERRDFTINALYCDADGTVVDLVGGLADIEGRVLRFIGDPEDRIREDYLRILRFFRFFAWYGSGRPDAAGLKACARLKDGLSRLSAERVWGELRRLFSAPDPSRALLWMRQTGVLTAVLPESEKWGIDAMPGLVETESALKWQPDALLRLMAIVPPEPARMEAMAKRLRMSGAEAQRLDSWAHAITPPSDMSELALQKLLYRAGKPGIVDRLRLSLASARARAANDDAAMMEAGRYSRLLKAAKAWDKPVFPLNGRDLAELGMQSGKAMGQLLASLEAQWVDAGFHPDRGALLARATEMLDAR